jgi:hypothetical protein
LSASVLCTTNIIENSNGTVRRTSQRVTNYSDADMALRWTAAGFIEAQKSFRKIQGIKDLWILKAALGRADKKAHVDEAKLATSRVPHRRRLQLPVGHRLVSRLGHLLARRPLFGRAAVQTKSVGFIVAHRGAARRAATSASCNWASVVSAQRETTLGFASQPRCDERSSVRRSFRLGMKLSKNAVARIACVQSVDSTSAPAIYDAYERAGCKRIGFDTSGTFGQFELLSRRVASLPSNASSPSFSTRRCFGANRVVLRSQVLDS